MNPTVVVQLPIFESNSQLTFAERLTNECDVKYNAGYQLASSFSPSPATVILIFQIPVKGV